MTPEQNKAKTIFLNAVEISTTAERQAYVEAQCGADEALRREVEELLGHYAAQGAFLEAPVDGRAGTIDLPAPAEPPGTVIGPYKLVELIGEGGMGIVWMAQQTEPVKRVVALKLIKAGMDSKQVIARFEAERQALALMDHANIARVLDAGTTDAGRPYFVMDLVKGVPITKYCDENRLTPRQRLELFVPVCQAVQHAHQKGIIHRDLKPSNVLVALYDGRPVPKVIDFGVAKAAGQQLTEKTLVTGFGAIVGTLEYMSPEQVEINQLDIDTRSDIYSLGVLLYELLAGSPPFTQKDLEKAGMLEMLRVIREQEPSRPSAKLSTAEGLPTLAANRGTEPAKLTKLVRGELDWIVMKSLEKDRSRRYETANGFAMDVHRYLNDEPVQACPPSPGYRLRKLLRRNKGVVMAASLVVITLLVGIVGTTVGMARAERRAVGERRAKENVQTRLTQIEKGTEILASVFRDLDPMAADEEGVTARELLHRRLVEAAQQLEGDAVGDPPVVARLQHVLGVSLRELGHLEQAKKVLEKALQTRERFLGADHFDTIATKHHLAMLYREQGKFAEAEALQEEVLKAYTARRGPDDPDTIRSQLRLATLYRYGGKFALAEPLIEKALAVQRAQLGADDPETLLTWHELAVLYHWQGRYDLAEAQYKEVLKKRTARLGPKHLDTAATKDSLASLYLDQRKLDSAEPLFQDVLDIRLVKLGPNHAHTLRCQQALAEVYQNTGQRDRSIALLVEVVKRRKAGFGPDHVDTLEAQANLGALYFNAGRNTDAIAPLEEVYRYISRVPGLERVGPLLVAAYARSGKAKEATAIATEYTAAAQKLFSDDRPKLAFELARVGEGLMDGGVYVAAEPIFRESLAIAEKQFPDAWGAHGVRSQLGEVLARQNRYAEAEPLLVQGYLGQKKLVANMPQSRGYVITAAERIVGLYDAWRKPAEAAKWRKELENIKQKP